MTLPGITDACYDVLVTNDVLGGGQTVWSQGVPTATRLGQDQGVPPGPARTSSTAGSGADGTTLCATQFGNATGGDIAYVGTCDADLSVGGTAGPNGGRMNSVTLWVDGIYDGGADLEEWQDPCPGGCTLEFECIENQDTLVEFNFTIMRDANQGFFDVAVNFEDVFCSAKLDNCYTNGDHVELLHGADEVRDWTAVFGFACTAGAGDANTTLLYGDLAVVCGGTTFPIDPTLDQGNQSATVGGHTLHYGIYRGTEQLNCGGASCNKQYWNLAFSLDDLVATGGTCTLAFSATATDGTAGFANGLPVNAGVAYPYIDVDATLTDAGVASCQQNPLNGTGSAVTTGYHGDVVGALALAPMCSFANAGSAGAVAGATGCGTVDGPVGLFVGTSNQALYGEIGTSANNPYGQLPNSTAWILSMEGEGLGIGGTYASLLVKPTVGGDPIVVATDYKNSAFGDEDSRTVLFDKPNALDPTKSDLYVAEAPDWTPVLLEAGLVPRLKYRIVDNGLVAYFTQYIYSQDSNGEPRYAGYLHLGFKSGAGTWMTQDIMAGTSGVENADKIGEYTLRYANGTLFFLSDYYHIGCGGGVLGVTTRTGDAWTTSSPYPGQTAEIGSPNQGKRKICYDYHISADGSRSAHYTQGGVSGSQTYLTTAPTFSVTEITLPENPSTGRKITRAFTSDGAWLYVLANDTPGQPEYVVSTANVSTRYKLGSYVVRSGNGNVAAALDAGGDLVVATAARSWTKTQVTTGGGLVNWSAALSSDGAALAYLKDDGGSATAYVAESAGGWSSTLVEAGVDANQGIAFSTSGRTLAYLTNFDPNLYVGTLNAATASGGWSPRIVDTDAYVNMWSALSPDGSALVYFTPFDADNESGPLTWAGVLPGPTGAPVSLGLTGGEYFWVSNTRIVGLVWLATTDSYTIPLPAAPVP